MTMIRLEMITCTCIRSGKKNKFANFMVVVLLIYRPTWDKIS